MRRRRKRRNRFKFFLLQIFLMGCLILMIYSGYKIITWIMENNQNKKIMDDIYEDAIVRKDDKYMIDMEKLKRINSDTVGWIEVESTNIGYPIVQTTDNNYYLTHSFDKSYNRAGWIFADFRNKMDGTDQNIVVYGHNRRDGSMFGTLKNTLSEDWYNNEDNMEIYLQIGEIVHKYKIFSIYKILQEEYYLTTDFDNEDDFMTYLDRAKSKSIKDFNVELSKDDKILTLSSCNIDGSKRIVLHAKLVTDNL